MSEEEKPKCPYCGSTKRRKRYNKWHVREVYCAECHRCLNRDRVREQTALAERASSEGRLDDFHMGTYVPEDDANPKESESEQ